MRFPLQPNEVKDTDGESVAAPDDGEREREREREEALASVGGVIALAPAAQSLSLSEEIRTHLVSLLSASSIETEE